VTLTALFHTEEDFIASVLMTPYPTVLVEGKKDLKFYEPFFDTKHHRNMIRYPDFENVKNSKSAVLKAIETINKIAPHKSRKFIAIIDSDFNHITNSLRKDIENLFYTDYHDSEMFIFSSDAILDFFYNILSEFDEEKVHHIINLCRKIALELGYFKFVFYELKDYDLNDYIKNIESYVDDTKDMFLLNLLKKDITKGYYDTFEPVLKLVEKYKNENLEISQLTNGHDMARILSRFLAENRFRLKIDHPSMHRRSEILHHSAEFNDFVEEIEMELRLAYDSSYFEKTELYRAIVQYQKSHDVEFMKP
jgi:hypothetical protein